MPERIRITLHPLNPDGSIDENTNLYPKTLISGIVNDEGEEVNVVDDASNQEIDGTKTFLQEVEVNNGIRGAQGSRTAQQFVSLNPNDYLTIGYNYGSGNLAQRYEALLSPSTLCFKQTKTGGTPFMPITPYYTEYCHDRIKFSFFESEPEEPNEIAFPNASGTIALEEDMPKLYLHTGTISSGGEEYPFSFISNNDQELDAYDFDAFMDIYFKKIMSFTIQLQTMKTRVLSY